MTSQPDSSPAARMAAQQRPWPERFGRLLRYRLIIPITRSTQPPEHSAKGVAVGLAWGLTPTIGIQMALCFFTWVITRKFFNWDFSVVIAMAWTWTTNVLTAFPCFYLFFITGQIILGRFDDLSGYDQFLTEWDAHVVENQEMGYLESAWQYTILLAKGWGVPLVIGCLPWSALGGFGGYYISLRFIRRHRAAKQRRRAEKLKQMQAERNRDEAESKRS